MDSVFFRITIVSFNYHPCEGSLGRT